MWRKARLKFHSQITRVKPISYGETAGNIFMLNKSRSVLNGFKMEDIKDFCKHCQFISNKFYRKGCNESVKGSRSLGSKIAAPECIGQGLGPNFEITTH